MSAASATEAGQVQRALTSRQPWASLIVAGVKDVENRSWPVPATLPQSRFWRCRAGDDVIIPQRHLIPKAHHIKDPSGISGRWCEAGYEPPDGPFPFRLWIHAGQGRERVWNASEAYEALARATHDEPYEPWMVAATVALMSLGALLGSVLVTGCHWSDDDLDDDGVPSWRRTLCSPWAEPNAYHWTLADPQPLPEPIPMKGHQRLWTLPDDVAVPA